MDFQEFSTLFSRTNKKEIHFHSDFCNRNVISASTEHETGSTGASGSTPTEKVTVYPLNLFFLEDFKILTLLTKDLRFKRHLTFIAPSYFMNFR